MIMDLINRLEEEAGEEASEKAYCDEELRAGRVFFVLIPSLGSEI